MAFLIFQKRAVECRAAFQNLCIRISKVFKAVLKHIRPAAFVADQKQFFILSEARDIAVYLRQVDICLAV